MKKIQVLLKPQCNAEIQNQFATKFGDQCEFTFQGKETEDAIAAAEVVIGEPEEEEILKAENLRFTLLSANMRKQIYKNESIPDRSYINQCFRRFWKDHIRICDREYHCAVP